MFGINRKIDGVEVAERDVGAEGTSLEVRGGRAGETVRRSTSVTGKVRRGTGRGLRRALGKDREVDFGGTREGS